jgi:hypothetical protein
MAYTVSKVDVWAGTIMDRPGGLAGKLEALSRAGANLELVISRRAPEKRGTGVVFLAPVKGAAQTNAAKKAGLRKSTNLRSLRVEGPDRAGLGTKITLALADAGINMRGLSAAALGRRTVVYFAFDTAADATKAGTILRRVLK